jgi:chromosome segregation protein
MDISKLTIQGFKSFYEKSVFTFDSKITGIVGPNGSGKSNITEAIRFVLGEQSSKSMRGKDITDMLFRGNSAKASKAKVEIEFVKSKTFRQFANKGNLENIFVKNALEKDSVIISRSIFADGKSNYEMNGVEVRLKDLTEFLLYIHLGNKSSWHISQGEADRVLQANSVERKTIIEDALGLKVYHARINESVKKLEKTRLNIREATIKRKELMPELTALSRQVDRIKRGVEFRTELESKASVFLAYKTSKINSLKQEDKNEDSLEVLHEKLKKLDEKITEKEKSLYKNGSHDISFLESELEKEEKVLNYLRGEIENFSNKKRNIENNLQYSNLEYDKQKQELVNIESELKSIASVGNDIIFSEQDINKTKDEIELNTEKIINSNDIGSIKELSKESDFAYKKLLSKGSVVTKDNIKQISYLQSIKSRIQDKLTILKTEIENLNNELLAISPNLENENLKFKISNERYEEIKKQILEFKFAASEHEREMQMSVYERSNLQIQIREKQDFTNKIFELENEYINDKREFENILGNMDKTPGRTGGESAAPGTAGVLSDEEFINLRRAIERLKIRLEESQVTNPAEVMQNFENMTAQDNFLLKEISDLENSMINLEKLILDLKISLKQEFDLGLEHINNIFDSYVKRLFGGGSAKVFVVELESKKKSVGEEGESSDVDTMVDKEEEEVKIGVEVEVEIPKKKVKGLHSLSGGERALVSIALNFSIINQNPAPFMILDETDAALDEANSKRYGEILDMLKDQTKLIVVTHNRETMHFANQVYGVTLAKEGHSKVLSVSFEDAIEYAK